MEVCVCWGRRQKSRSRFVSNHGSPFLKLCFFRVNETKSSSGEESAIHPVCMWLQAASLVQDVGMEEGYNVLLVCVFSFLIL